jgi:hypothetical protein
MGNSLSSMDIEPAAPEEKPAPVEKPKKNKRGKTRRKRSTQTANKTLSNLPDQPPEPLLSPEQLLAMTDNGIMVDDPPIQRAIVEPETSTPAVEPEKPVVESRKRGPRRRST